MLYISVQIRTWRSAPNYILWLDNYDKTTRI